MVLNLDLNSPPVEGTSATVSRQGASAESSKGLVGSPIDVEELDDEVELLSSSAGFPQRRGQPRRNRQIIVDLDQPMEIFPMQSGVSVAEPAAILLSLSSHNNYERTSTTRNYANHQQYFDLEEDDNIKGQGQGQGQGQRKRKEAMTSFRIEPQRSAPSPPQPPPTPPPKEPNFTCPLCMDPLTNPCSTFCGHIFCQSCIEASIAASVKKKAGKQCPSCRAKLPVKKSFHRVYLPNADC